MASQPELPAEGRSSPYEEENVENIIDTRDKQFADHTLQSLDEVGAADEKESGGQSKMNEAVESAEALRKGDGREADVERVGNVELGKIDLREASPGQRYPAEGRSLKSERVSDAVFDGSLPTLPALVGALRPPTGQSAIDRPARDFPAAPDYKQLIGPTHSLPESDNVGPESRASPMRKYATGRLTLKDGAKSVAFADDVKSEDGVKSPDTSGEDETDTKREELFATTVSEEKIEEATRKMKIRSATETTGFDKLVEMHSGSDLINKRSNEHYERGCELGNSGKHFASIVAFDKAINLCPGEVRCYLMRGEAYLQVTDFRSAIQNFKKACVLRPASDIFYSKLAFVYYLQGQSLFDQCLFTKSLESFARAAEMRPETVGYHTRSIACLAALERHGECLALVNKRLEVEHSNPDLYIMRARLHLLFRNTSLSYYDLKDAVALDPEQHEAQNLLQDLERRARDNRDFAVRLQLQQKFKDALQKITLAIEMDPSVAEFHLLRGSIHRRLHDFNAAIDDFLLSLDKTDHDEGDKVYMDAQRQLLLTYNDFAVDCFLGNHFDEAILLLNKSIKGEKREKGLYVNRGDCFFRLGELHFSLSDYHQALELDPHDSLVRGRIAGIHSEFGSMDYEEQSYQDSEARFTVAIQHNPQNGQYYLNRAKGRFMLENHAGARQDILISLHLNPNNDGIHSLLARLFPGKSVADVMRSKAAREAKQILDNAVVTASPVRLPVIPRSASGGLLKSLDVLKEDKEEAGSPFVLFMNANDFSKALVRRKKMVDVDVKGYLHDRASLQKSGPKLKPHPPPRNYVVKGGHWKQMETQPPRGWRHFGQSIELKEA